MNPTVSFHSSAFSAPEDGRHLAAYLAEHLPAQGFPRLDCLAEEQAWRILVHYPAFTLMLALGCVRQGESADDDSEYVCAIHAHAGNMQSWLRKLDSKLATEKLVQALDVILQADPRIRNIRWQAA